MGSERGFQKHTLVGRLGGTPEQHELSSGAVVTNFSLAVNQRNRDGSETTTWYRIAAWNGLGRTCAKHLAKGRRILVEGTRMKASAWIDEDGNPRASLELTADTIIFLDGPREDAYEDAYEDEEFYEDEDEEPTPEPVQRPSNVRQLPARNARSRQAPQNQAKQTKQAAPAQAVRQAAGSRRTRQVAASTALDDVPF